jgi:hypothetical protein
MLNKIKALWARLWPRRDRRTSEHEFYDQRRPVGTGPRPRHGDRGIRPVETLTLCSGGGVPSCGTGLRPRLGGFGIRVVVSVLSMGSMTSVPPAGIAIGRTSTLPGGRATTIRLAHDPPRRVRRRSPARDSLDPG